MFPDTTREVWGVILFCTLTDSSRPGFRGLKLQEMMMELGLMEEELWNVHFRRTSVPLTASTSPDVYIRIPLTCSTPATYKHMAQQCLLQKSNSGHTEQNLYIDKWFVKETHNTYTNIQHNTQHESTLISQFLPCACSVPSDPTSAYAVLLIRHYNIHMRYIYYSTYWNPTDWSVYLKYAIRSAISERTQTSVSLHPESPDWFHIRRPNLWHLMNDSHFSCTTAAETGLKLTVCCILYGYGLYQSKQYVVDLLDGKWMDWKSREGYWQRSGSSS